MDKKLFQALVDSFKEADKNKRLQKMMDWRDHISADPHVMEGRACIAGTLVRVSVVLDNLASGMSKDELLAEFPSLTPESIAAALAYAADLTRERVIAAAVTR